MNGIDNVTSTNSHRMNWDDTNKMFVKIPIPALILFKLSLNQPLNKS